MKPLEQRIAELIRAPLKAMDIDLVQVVAIDGKNRKTIQIFAENAKTGRITLDECAVASRTISTLLDVEDVIKGAYNLEVSSPGIDRPLLTPEDYRRHIGHEVKIETALPVDGRRRFRGELFAAEGNEVGIRVDQAEFRLNVTNIVAARPVLTDALIKAMRR